MYKAHGSVVLTSAKRFVLGLVPGSLASVEGIKPFLYPCEETWRNPPIDHILSCVLLYKQL